MPENETIESLAVDEVDCQNKKIKKHAGGRPTVMTDIVLQKLQECFSLGSTDEEACFYADIGMSTLYKYQESHPEFVERKEKLKQLLILKARNTVVNDLDDPKSARWYLDKKGKDFQKNETGTVNFLTQINNFMGKDVSKFMETEE